MASTARLELSALGPVRPPAESVIAAAARREEQGFDAVWWADHLLHWFPQSVWTPDLVPAAAAQPSPHVWMDPFPMIGAAALRTTRIRLGVGVTDLVRNHPAQLARAALTLDHLSGGRFVLGLGTGEALNLTPYGLGNTRPLSRLAEGLELIRRFFADPGPIDHEGEHFHLRGASIGLRPLGAPPPIWIAAHRPRGLDLAGRAADGWLPLATDPGDYARMLGRVRAAAADAGRPDAVTPGAYVRVVVTRRHDDAVRAIDDSFLLRFIALTRASEAYEVHGATHPLGAGAFGLTSFLPTALDRAEALRLAESVPVEVRRDTVVHGTPDEVANRIAAFVAAGARHVQLTNMTPLVAPELAAESEALLGEAVTAVRERSGVPA